MVTGNRNVLVVDDEQPMREMMSNILADMDCEVFLAEGAADALAQVKQQDFAVIFLDLKLFGMNGIDPQAQAPDDPLRHDRMGGSV